MPTAAMAAHHAQAASFDPTPLTNPEPQALRDLSLAPATNELSGRCNPAKLLANLAAISLVTASAGFGCWYSWSTNIGHGPVLAALAVVGVLGLELAKPIALAGALEAASAWRLGRALALGTLAAVAVLYSLTSELSLIARSRADASGQRAATSQAATDVRERVSTLKAEIARHDSTLTPAAPIAPAAPDCAQVWLPGPKQRADCLAASTLHAQRVQAHLELVKQQGDEVKRRADERRRLVERLDASLCASLGVSLDASLDDSLGASLDVSRDESRDASLAPSFIIGDGATSAFLVVTIRWRMIASLNLKPCSSSSSVARSASMFMHT